MKSRPNITDRSISCWGKKRRGVEEKEEEEERRNVGNGFDRRIGRLSGEEAEERW